MPMLRPATRPSHLLAISAYAVALLAGACHRQAVVAPAHTNTSATPTPEALRKPTPADTKPADFPGLHQVVAYTSNFYSGAAPEGQEAFASLAALGVRTIISVDGARPDVALAQRHGLRYIHLPIGYNGFDEQRRKQLARATKDALATGGVYLHCHHGKHRSAGAVGTTAVSLGLATNDAMLARMRVSQCAESYKGLWARTRDADVLSEAQLASVDSNFPSVSPPGSFIESMVDIDAALEHLALIQKAGWQTPNDHPDLVPTAEAAIAADILRVLADKATARKQDEFASLMHASANAAQSLEDMLGGSSNPQALDAQLAIVARSCKDCHVKFRD
jgi:protein tyrosine phosphatase (PTP) superfamily phosphohydrolase (DUF442 family)